MIKKVFTKTVKKKLSLDYAVRLPAGYGDDAERIWPMIVYLHGGGETKRDSGKGLEALLAHSLPKMLETRDMPFVVLMPQCPELSWTMYFEDLFFLINEIASEYRVDVERLYLTGLSLGGYGTWDFAILHPGMFAAIAPLCAGCSYWWEWERVKDVPVWAFHGALDTAVPVTECLRMISPLKEAGADVTLTIYPDAYHNVWDRAYTDAGLYEWFLRYRRKK